MSELFFTLLLIFFLVANGLDNATRDARVGRSEPRKHNFRLMVDPALNQGPTRIIRYDGVLPGVGVFSISLSLWITFVWNDTILFLAVGSDMSKITN